MTATKTLEPATKKPSKVQVQPPEAEYLDTAQAAAFMGLGVSTLETWRSRNREQGPPYFKVGRAVRYRVSDLRTFMQKHPRNV